MVTAKICSENKDLMHLITHDFGSLIWYIVTSKTEFGIIYNKVINTLKISPYIIMHSVYWLVV